MNYLKIISISIILSSCSPGIKDLEPFMVDISAFNIDNSLLKDGDKVEILGSSGNLSSEHHIDFYNLVVVRSLETGDTINVLVTNYFMADLNNPETMFISNSSNIGKLIENNSEIESMDDFKLKDLKSKKYSKVFYDTEYIQVDVMEHPSIIGNLGDYTIEGDLHEMNLEDWN